MLIGLATRFVANKSTGVSSTQSSTQSSADELIDVRAVVAIVRNVEAAEVVLKDVVGHGVAVIVEPCWASWLQYLWCHCVP